MAGVRPGEREEAVLGLSSYIPSAPGRQPGKVSETHSSPLGAGLVALKQDVLIASKLTPPEK